MILSCICNIILRVQAFKGLDQDRISVNSGGMESSKFSDNR
jgi:hypothetical protein